MSNGINLVILTADSNDWFGPFFDAAFAHEFAKRRGLSSYQILPDSPHHQRHREMVDAPWPNRTDEFGASLIRLESRASCSCCGEMMVPGQFAWSYQKKPVDGNYVEHWDCRHPDERDYSMGDDQ